MAKIKIDEIGRISVYYSEVGGGLYESVKNYKIDLTNKKRYQLKTSGDIEIDWGLTEEEELAMIDNLIKESSFNVENCYNVIYSYKQSGNISQVEKHKIFLDNNKKILEFLKNYFS